MARQFSVLSLNYFGGASIASLLVVYTRHIDLTYLAIIIPLLLVMYLTFKTAMARVEDAKHHLAQMNSLHQSTIETLAMAIDAKDQVTPRTYTACSAVRFRTRASSRHEE